ncbi:MAG: polyprenyl synthetase family protein [Candidatus Wenzhouxiangella sp. M2_3B_020]
MSAIVDVAAVRGRSSGGSGPLAAVERWRERVDGRLETLIDSGDEACPRLLETMRYSLLSRGKRVRPLLAILTALDFDNDPEPLLDFGCALEMVHCASLMLDDLPCMDDARMRRGQPAAHLRFGEATTTLAAIALLNHSYGVLARSRSLPRAVRTALVAELSEAVGTAGLVSGQSRDLGERNQGLDDEAMRRINRQKTGVLFELAVVGAGMILDLPQRRLAALNDYAGHVGLAFQAADDLLDARRSGLDTGKDREADLGKGGSVHQIGEAELRDRLETELVAAERELAELELADGLLHRYVRALFDRLG